MDSSAASSVKLIKGERRLSKLLTAGRKTLSPVPVMRKNCSDGLDKVIDSPIVLH